MTTTLLHELLQSFPSYFCIPLLLYLLFLYKTLFSHSSGKTLPPSPRKLPIIGNLHQIGALHHRSLWSLSKRYGELMLLHLGSKPTLVVSSGSATQEIMKTHDTLFSNRPHMIIPQKIFYGGKDIGFASYGPYWKQVRGICVTQLLSNKKVQSYRAIREEETALIVEKITKSCGTEVNVSEILMTYANNVICRASLGKRYTDDHENGAEFKKLISEAMKLIAEFSTGDCIPWLGWVDRITGLIGTVEKVAEGLDEILQKVIEENQIEMNMDVKGEKGEKVKNFVEILLNYKKQNKDELAPESIKGVILDMFVAGTDVISALIEWAIAELIKHPSIMKQVQEEVRTVVKGGKVCEDDLDKMSYLKAVIKEVLRLHPPTPVLLARESPKDVKIKGYDIAAGTQVLINAWAIHRDPVFWEEPEKFQPERFLKGNLIDFKSQDFHFIPFRGGKRICPGMPFGLINAELVIATLLYEFEWGLPLGVNVEELDMTEMPGQTVCRRDPLMAIATPFVCS